MMRQKIVFFIIKCNNNKDFELKDLYQTLKEMRNKFRFITLLAICSCSILLVSCFKKSSSNKSMATGWNYNNPNNQYIYNFQDFSDQKPGPGLVAIQGGTFTMGATMDNVYYEWDNTPRQVTVSSFYIDETEVRNIDYLEYIYWLQHIYGADMPEMVSSALPDTMVWRNSLAYNEPMVEVYFRHPAYRDYPVVGVSWLKANRYALWRSDRVNEMLLIDAGVIEYDPDQNKDNYFSTDAYLTGIYNAKIAKGVPDYNKGEKYSRNAKMEDGIMLPKYRLPTEAEWEYAALALIGATRDERIVERRTYPWNTDGLRTDEKDHMGDFTANFKRGRGDYQGVAGYNNDGYDFPAPVKSYWPNDFGLYNMAGNVSEWVADVYRPLSYEDFSEQNPFRGNEFTKTVIDSTGKITQVPMTQNEISDRQNFRDSYSVNQGDGDYMSTIQTDWNNKEKEQSHYTSSMYDYGNTTLITDHSRIYKGGSWADGPYYLSPSVRRFLQEDQASSTIGFRCAMNMIKPAFKK